MPSRGADDAALPKTSAGIYNVDTAIATGHQATRSTMDTVIRKWGNSPAVRLPKHAVREAGLSLEQRVNLTVTKGRIVIEPVSSIEYDLDSLVEDITPKNSHGETDFGPSVGKEAW